MLAASEIGKRAGVSETTVIRFCYALGYKGFTEMQKEWKHHLLASKGELETFVDSKRQWTDEPHSFARMMDQDRENIAALIRTLDGQRLHETVQMLKEADQVLVAGLYASYPAALWFGMMLNLLRGQTRVFRPGIDQLTPFSMEMDSHWTVLLFSFRRYAWESVQLAQMAKRQGAKVIIITDSLLSPFNQAGDVVIPLVIERTTAIDLMAPLFSLLHALLSLYTLEDCERVKERMRSYDTATEMNAYYESDV